MLETVAAACILLAVLWAGCCVEVVRKLAKQLAPLRSLYATFCRRCPYTAETLERFVEIWDMFVRCSDASLGFEDRFAIFCDQLGDFLEGLVQRAVDVLELFFQLDANEQAAALCRIPRRRLSAAEARSGAGPLAVTSCAICLCDWRKGDDVRELKALLRPEAAVAQLQAGLQALQAHPAGTVINVIALGLMAAVALRFALGVLRFVWAYFLRPRRNLRWYGQWAVVTGATDGIGKEYAAQLARQGLNLVLISRTESKLQDAAAELEGKHNVQVKYVAADLCKAGPDTFAKIAAALEGLEVGILVNNAGLSYDHPEYLDEVEDGFITDLVTINALVPAMLSKLVLKGMRARRRGVVINVGSGVSTVIPASPLLSVYAGSKAFVDAFSRSLDAEYAPLGVRVQNQSPMFVATKMSKIRRARLDAPTPAAWAAAALQQIGRETSFTPYWFHGLQQAVIRLAPEWLVNRQVMRMHQGFRSRYYRRLARQQAEAAAAAAGEASAGEGQDEAPKRELRRRK